MININTEGVKIFLIVKKAEMHTTDFGDKGEGLVFFLYTIKATTAPTAITATAKTMPMVTPRSSASKNTQFQQKSPQEL